MKTYVSILALVTMTVVAFAAELRPIPDADNLLDAVRDSHQSHG